MQLVLFVLSNPEKLEALLSAWNNAGAPGVTILASTGVVRLRQGGMLRDDFPLIPGLDALFGREETTNRTLFTLLPDDNLVEADIAATQQVLGNLERPNTGILLVLPVSRALGLHKECP